MQIVRSRVYRCAKVERESVPCTFRLVLEDQCYAYRDENFLSFRSFSFLSLVGIDTVFFPFFPFPLRVETRTDIVNIDTERDRER